MHYLNDCNAINAWKAELMNDHFELQALHQFLTVARAKNFTRAAAELHLSQSALSRAIQKLEEQLEAPLFERRPREVVLTDLGEWLLGRAHEILKLVEDTYAELQDAKRWGRVRLGAIPTIAPYLLPALLGRFAEQFPDVAVMVQEDTTEMLIQRCHHGELDLAIVALPIEAKEIRVEALFAEELLFVAPLGHPLATVKNLTAQEVEHYPFVMLNEAHCLSGNITSFCQRQAVQPVTVERTSQLTTVQELVSLDHGVSIIPEMARRIDLSDRRVYRSFSGEKPERTVAMMWNAYRYESRAVKTLKDFIRQATKKRTASALRDQA
jgi:LysR family hydrogen peroxide-inducible transcriptional activator